MVYQCLVLHFLPGKVVGSKSVPVMQNLCSEHWQCVTTKCSLLLFEELKNIENRVAWFLAELCKAEKGVQKDKRNQRRTELVRGRLAPRVLLCTAISRAPRGQVAQIPSFEVVHDFNGGGNAGWRSLVTLHLNTCHNFKGDFADLIATYRFGKAKQGHEAPSPR